ARDVSIGQTVAAGFQTPTLFAIAQDLGKMEVDLQVGEPDIGSVRAGDHVDFTVLAYPTRTFSGIVSQVRQNPTTVQNVVTYTTVVLVDNKDGALRPGMTANATIDTSKIDNATIVPVAALQYRPASFTGGTRSHQSAQSGGSPWGSASVASGSAIVNGTRGRVFVEGTNGKLRFVPVQIQMVSGADAAVEPLRGSLNENDAAVVADNSHTTRRPASSGSPFSSQSRGVRVPGGR
ncbi:MAG: efflux RND transporter periplasmic adaptor subunit, partial [Candidatus Eremiobacteraeota bacterium]|nr:efflux RND transporter periplasmic adaptor subunit [Candidatus Eremiobacteraeota bacterium]